MKLVATPWNGLSKSLLVVFGIPFTIIGLALTSHIGNLLYISNGVLWIVISVILKVIGVTKQHRIEVLRKMCHCYDCSVVNIIPAHGVRIGSYITARVECIYETENGKCLIKSGYYLLSPFDKIENLYVKIYFDYNNPEKYAMELFIKDNDVSIKS